MTLRLAALAASARALVPAPASADVPEGTATPVVLGADAAAVFDQAVDAHYAALASAPACAPATGCASVVARRMRIDRKAVVELRTADAAYGPVAALIVTDGAGHAWPAAVFDDLRDGDCGMGKCVTTRLGALTVKRVGPTLWISARIHATRTYSERHHVERSAYQLVVGCRLDPVPACATVRAGDPFTPGRATFVGTTVKVHERHGDRTVAVVFPPSVP